MIMGALNSTCNVKCQISVWLGTEGYPLQAKHSEQCSTILLCRRWYAQYTSGLECLRCSVRTANRPGVLNGHLSAAIGEEVEGGEGAGAPQKKIAHDAHQGCCKNVDKRIFFCIKVRGRKEKINHQFRTLKMSH